MFVLQFFSFVSILLSLFSASTSVLETSVPKCKECHRPAVIVGLKGIFWIFVAWVAWAFFSVKHWTTTPPKSTHHGVGGAILKTLRGLEATCFGHFVSNKNGGKLTFLAYRVHIMWYHIHILYIYDVYYIRLWNQPYIQRLRRIIIMCINHMSSYHHIPVFAIEKIHELLRALRQLWCLPRLFVAVAFQSLELICPRCLHLEIAPLGKFYVIIGILIILHLQTLALQICGSYAPSASNVPSREFVVLCLQTFRAFHVSQCSFAEVKHPICPHWQWPCGGCDKFCSVLLCKLKCAKLCKREGLSRI